MEKLAVIAVDIRSTHNIGSIIRTADGFGAEVVLCGISPRVKNLQHEDRLPHVIEKTHSEIAKTALGAENNINISYFKNINDALEYYKSNKFKIYALEQNTVSRPITSMITRDKVAILLGPEVTGLNNEILNKCDDIFEIPMTGSKESFNVSVACGIALYQARLEDIKHGKIASS
jgi:tRNA G18 (ribose-2'-O)-methylase SpoU